MAIVPTTQMLLTHPNLMYLEALAIHSLLLKHGDRFLQCIEELRRYHHDKALPRVTTPGPGLQFIRAQYPNLSTQELSLIQQVLIWRRPVAGTHQMHGERSLKAIIKRYNEIKKDLL